MIIACTETTDIELTCNELLKGIDIDIEKHRINNFISIDLLNLFLEVYKNDIETKRDMYKKTNFNIKVYVNAKNLDTWNENKDLIIRLTDFVTECDNDKWNIDFIPVEYKFEKENTKLNIIQNIDNISLLSGGLDSFCGAYKNESNNESTIYCGYKTSNMDYSSIKNVNSFLYNRKGYKGIDLYERINQKKQYYHQRTRSLLFLAIAIFSAVERKINVVKINENGIMGLNPSFESRATTKTTHPKTIYLYQKLLNNIGLNIKLEHPFLFTTKGEMINLLNNEYKNHIRYTRSCGISFQNKNYNMDADTSCGACVPCLLRKISISAYDLEKYDNQYIIPYEEKSKIYQNFNNGKLNDYHSSLSYFKKFYEAIESGMIFTELNIRKNYYKDKDYLEKTQIMLEKFKEELSIFMKKYDK